MNKLKEEWPKDIDGLIKYFEELKAYSTDYNTSAEAVAYGTAAAFNYLASEEHGLSGYQASWSAMKFFQLTRNIEGAFTVVSTDELKYKSTTDVLHRVNEFLHTSLKEEHDRKKEEK
jgi:hypothetical protein